MIVKTIGRGQDNNIVVNDENVSRVHLQMVQDDNGYISVVDLGSTNGTFVNGSRITGETRLKPGDELRIGDTKLPWQQYFLRPQHPSSSVHTTHTQPPRRNMMWLYITIGVVFALFAIGGVLMHVHNKKEKELMRSELEEKNRQLEDERKAAGEDYRNLSNQNENNKKKLSEKEEELDYYKSRAANNKNSGKIRWDAIKKEKEVVKQEDNTTVNDNQNTATPTPGGGDFENKNDSNNVGASNSNSATPPPDGGNSGDKNDSNDDGAADENNSTTTPSSSASNNQSGQNAMIGGNGTNKDKSQNLKGKGKGEKNPK
jgi:hypothetical protein